MSSSNGGKKHPDKREQEAERKRKEEEKVARQSVAEGRAAEKSRAKAERETQKRAAHAAKAAKQAQILEAKAKRGAQREQANDEALQKWLAQRQKLLENLEADYQKLLATDDSRNRRRLIKQVNAQLAKATKSQYEVSAKYEAATEFFDALLSRSECLQDMLEHLAPEDDSAFTALEVTASGHLQKLLKNPNAVPEKVKDEVLQRQADKYGKIVKGRACIANWCAKEAARADESTSTYRKNKDLADYRKTLTAYVGSFAATGYIRAAQAKSTASPGGKAGGPATLTTAAALKRNRSDGSPEGRGAAPLQSRYRTLLPRQDVLPGASTSASYPTCPKCGYDHPKEEACSDVRYRY